MKPAAAVSVVCCFLMASLAANAQRQSNLLGGPRGMVRSAAGEPLEGIMVQLESQVKSIKTTVYSGEDGRYEFPKLESGSYALRVAKPLEFRPYEKDGVRIDGATPLPEIVLERVTDSEFLPPTPDIAVQLTGAEWLMNITGTADEKKTLANTCGGGCHSYRQIFRNRYDEHSWRLIVDRMLGTAAALLINPQPNNRHRFVHNEEEVDQIVKWLAKVRGPDAQDAPFKVFPRPRGLATRVIVTEYALPHLWCYSHDVAGDSKGNIWYTCHRSSYVGRLEPRTGVINEFKLPSTPGAYPGTHWVSIDKNDVAWFSENWAHKITKFDPKTEKFTSVHVADEGVPLNSAGVGNMALAPDGTIWDARGGFINQINPQTGEYLKRYPLKKVKSTYGSDMSWDGNSWAGGASPADFAVFLDIKTGEVREMPCPTPNCNPARGGFDPQGNAWFGGRGGPLLKVDGKTHRFTEYYPPTPYVAFYEAKPDKNGEVWAGELHGGRIARFNPRLERWVEYVLPEAEVHDRRIWIDNSTTPVTVWYVDHNERIVRIQPFE
jgi:streptogramin lyase